MDLMCDIVRDFILENLAETDKKTARNPDHMSVRLMRLIDVVMSARHQIRQLFAQAMSLTSAAKRCEFLDQACATCPELRASLERLLKSEFQSQRLLQFPASELIRVLLESLRSEMLPPMSQTPPVELTVPDDQDAEATLRVRSDKVFLASADEDMPETSLAFPRAFGRYTLEQELGRSAMETGFPASDRLLNRQMAHKVLRGKAIVRRELKPANVIRHTEIR